MNFNTPILFIVFNRPDVTQLVFNEIKKIKPKYLFVAADGPRLGKINETSLCEETQEIIHQINWDCELKTLFRTTNLGCGKAVSGAIDWFFENVEQGIILEDDCLPHSSFFNYCENLLSHYKNSPEIMHIGSVNFQDKSTHNNTTYYFSGIPHVWGWATWRRAWKLYDFKVHDFYKFVRENKIYNYFPNTKIAAYWLENFKLMYDQKIDTWDNQWMYTVLNNNGKSILPHINLTSNIGFGENATHTHLINEKIANKKTFEISKELDHPKSLAINTEADYYFFRYVEQLPAFYKRSLTEKIISKLKRLFIYNK